MSFFIKLIPLIIGVFVMPVLDVFFYGIGFGSVFAVTAVLIFLKKSWSWMEYTYLLLVGVLLDMAFGYRIGTYGLAILLSFAVIQIFQILFSVASGFGKWVAVACSLIVFHLIIAQADVNILGNLSWLPVWSILKCTIVGLLLVGFFEKLKSMIWVTDSISIKF
ncbi:hypothetical protein GF357_02935 [Candidatus Dojkabacteria bacterium]|nr:hypothetical protein [Candidatus Dojkabacteria bacterium]